MRFKYKGENLKFVTPGPVHCLKIRLPNGQMVQYEPIPPAKEFVPDTDIGHEIEDEEVIKSIMLDPRFEKI